MQAPERFNLAQAICRRHDDAETRVAVVEARAGGNNTYTFGAIDYLSDKLANSLRQSGVKEGDAVAVILPQSAALVIAHFGALKLGAAVVPLATDAEPLLIEHALADSDAKAVVIDSSSFERLKQSIASRANLESIFLDDDCREAPAGFKDFWRELYSVSPDFIAVETEAESPALIFYSDSAGNAVRVIYSHASAIGEIAASETRGDLSDSKLASQLLLTDWANPNSLLGLLYAALWRGSMVVASPERKLDEDELSHLFE